VSEGRISPRDADELARCFLVHAPDLFGWACVVARGDRVLADDLVQAAFEAAAMAWQTLRGLAEQQRAGWLHRTMSNIAISGFRREAALRDRLPRIELRYRRTVADPAEQAWSAIVLERCWQIIMGLPDRQHQVALMRWRLDMKLAEIAAVLGIDEHTVSVHLHRARLQLIAQLGPDHPFAGGDPDGAAP